MASQPPAATPGISGGSLPQVGGVDINQDAIFNKAQAKIAELQGQSSQYDPEAWAQIQGQIDKINKAIQEKNISEVETLLVAVENFDPDQQYSQVQESDIGGYSEVNTRGPKGMTRIDDGSAEEDDGGPPARAGFMDYLGAGVSGAINGVFSDEKLKTIGDGTRALESNSITMNADIEKALDRLAGVKD